MRPWFLTTAAAIGSAVLLALASPAIGIGWLAWVALVPVATAAVRYAGTRPARAAVPLAYGLYLQTQLVPALPFGVAEGQWGSPPLPVLVAGSPVVFAAVVAVPLFAFLLYVLRFPQPLTRPPLVAAALVPALVWTALDAIRTTVDPSGLWGPLFLTQHDLPTAVVASLAGPWLLTFLLVAAAWAAALLLVHRSAAVPAAVAVATLAAALAGAAVGIERTPAGEPLVIAVVQPGYDTAEHAEHAPVRYFAPERRDLARATRDLVADLGELTQEAAAAGAELVVWPEAVAWVDPRTEPGVRTAIDALVEGTGVALVVPKFLDPESAVVGFTPDGAPTELRPKRRPMWFLGERTIDAPRGTKEIGRAAVGTMLGVDNADPGSARELARRGAGVIASATHDWRELLPQQRAYARLHAAALGVPVAKADWRYGSAIWDGGARLVAEASHERRRTVLVAEVTLGTAATPYERIGDAVARVAVVAALGATVVAAAARRALRERRNAAPRSAHGRRRG